MLLSKPDHTERYHSRPGARVPLAPTSKAAVFSEPGQACALGLAAPWGCMEQVAEPRAKRHKKEHKHKHDRKHRHGKHKHRASGEYREAGLEAGVPDPASQVCVSTRDGSICINKSAALTCCAVRTGEGTRGRQRRRVWRAWICPSRDCSQRPPEPCRVLTCGLGSCSARPCNVFRSSMNSLHHASSRCWYHCVHQRGHAPPALAPC